MKKKRKGKRKPGPKAEQLKAQGANWKDALKHALQQPKPGEWPEAPKDKKKPPPKDKKSKEK